MGVRTKHQDKTGIVDFVTHFFDHDLAQASFVSSLDGGGSTYASAPRPHTTDGRGADA